MDSVIPFWENWDIWIEAVLVAVIGASALAYLGLWVTLKKVNYVPLAISQVAALGAVIAFWLHELAGAHAHGQEDVLFLLDPAWFSFLFTLATAFYFARPQSGADRPVVIAYLVASALALILGGFIRQDLHDLQDILFGHSVLAEMVQVVQVAAAAGLVLVIHLLFYRRFLFVSYDSDTAGAAGIRVYWTEVLLYATIAIMLSAATRCMGALPAFGLMILPALAGLQVGRSMGQSVLVAVAVGMISAFAGYYISFALGFSAGASMVASATLLLLVSWIIGKFR